MARDITLTVTCSGISAGGRIVVHVQRISGPVVSVLSAPALTTECFRTNSFSSLLVMGYSNDGFPYVGPVCGNPGQYMCAGFSGHGMPQIFFSAKAVASMVLTGNSEDVDLPVPYRISRSRWYQQKEHMSLKMWQQVGQSQPAQARL